MNGQIVIFIVIIYVTVEATLHAIFSTLPFAVCLIWSVLLFQAAWKHPVGALRMLAGFAVVCTVLYFCHAVYFNGEEALATRAVYRCANLAVYPLFWLYIRALSEAEPLPFRAFWVLIPAVVSLLLSVIAYALGAREDFAELPLRFIFLVEVAWVSIAGIRRLDAYDRKVHNFYADTEGKSMVPLRNLLYLVLLTSLVSALMSVMGRSVFASDLLLVIPSILFSVLLACIFYIGSRIEYTALEVSARPENSQETDPDTGEFQALMDRIVDQMETRQLFRTPGLKITDLATELGSNRTYVSNCINRMAGQSFSDYVNSYRIRYAQILMQMNDSGQTLSQIGTQAGFSGETSFFRNFKKITGQTPSEWLSSRKPSDKS